MGNSSRCWAGFSVVVVELPKRKSMPPGCTLVRGRSVVVVVVVEVVLVVLLVSGAKPKPGCGAWLPPAPAAAPPE